MRHEAGKGSAGVSDPTLVTDKGEESSFGREVHSAPLKTTCVMLHSPGAHSSTQLTLLLAYSGTRSHASRLGARSGKDLVLDQLSVYCTDEARLCQGPPRRHPKDISQHLAPGKVLSSCLRRVSVRTLSPSSNTRSGPDRGISSLKFRGFRTWEFRV